MPPSCFFGRPKGYSPEAHGTLTRLLPDIYLMFA
jgi:hypothetical protein